MERVEFVFFDAGGGHRAAATALKAVIQAESRPWDVQLANLQEIVDEIDILRKYAGIRIENFYNLLLRNDWTLGSTELMKVLQLAVRTYHRPMVRLFEKYWRQTQPAMVVSFVPHFNRVLFESYRNLFPTRPFVTILTDLADYPPHFWIEDQKQYFVCGSQKAVTQALAAGHTDDRVFHASGMILHPRFYEPQSAEIAEERRSLGLHPERPTALIMFGGYGNRAMAQIAERLDRSSLDLQLILICGKNKKLAESLRSGRPRLRRHVEGFTNRVPYFMHLSDFFIGKPGPGSISEAVGKHLPVIVERNAWTLPQERYNTEWVQEHQVGVVLESFRHIVPAVEELLDPETLAARRANTMRMSNRAVFEISEFLDSVLHGTVGSAQLTGSAQEGWTPQD